MLVHVPMVGLQVVEHVSGVSVFGLHSLAAYFADGEAVKHHRSFCVLQEAKIFPNGIRVLGGWMKLWKLRCAFCGRVLESFLREDGQFSKHSN